MTTIGQSARLTSRNVQVVDRNKLAVGEARSQEERRPYPTTEFDGGNGNLLHSLKSGSRQRALGESEESAENTTKSEAGDNSGSDNALGVSVIALAAVKTAIDTDSSGIQATDSAVATDSSGIETAKAAMKQNLTQLASDPQAFHAVMKASFGESYDQAKAETIRQQVLAGDFSWMPDIKVVDASVLQDQSGIQGKGQSLGAYSKENDTIYISEQLLQSDPDKALQILTEELGHGLDSRLNTSDAAGDEGDIFSRLVSGEQISTTKLSELRSENDSGVILVDGKEVEVEYGHLSNWGKKARNLGRKIDDNLIQPVKEAGKVALRGIETFAKAAIVRPFQEGWSAVKGYAKTVKQIFKGDWKEAGRTFRDTTLNLITAPVRLGLEGLFIGLHTTVAVWDTLRQDLEVRKLNNEEITYLEAIYGDSIDYSKVRIHRGGSKVSA